MIYIRLRFKILVLKNYGYLTYTANISIISALSTVKFIIHHTILMIS